MLLFDGIGGPHIRQGTHFLGRFAFTYQEGILAAIGENLPRVNAIFLLDRNEQWSCLHATEAMIDLLKGAANALHEEIDRPAP